MFYNNEEDCPYEDHCVFLHEESPMCKFADRCERDNCMFKHKKVDDTSEDEEKMRMMMRLRMMMTMRLREMIK